MPHQQTPPLSWLFFGLNGRISRAAFFLAGILLNLVPAFLFYRATLAGEQTAEGEIWATALWIAALVSLWSGFALGVKRLHDFGKPGVIAVALFVPVISIIAFIILCFIPGDPGANKYGSRTNAPQSPRA